MEIKKEQIQTEPWYWGSTPLREDQIPLWATAFIYKITRKKVTPRYGFELVAPDVVYIGKKQLLSTHKKKIGVRAQAAEKASRTDGKSHTVKKVTKSSGWENYWGSSKELQEAVKAEPQLYRREIIEWCYSKKNATYCEVKHIIKNNMLEKGTYNKNLLGSLYVHDTDRQLYEQFLDRKRKPVEDRKPQTRENYKNKNNGTDK